MKRYELAHGAIIHARAEDVYPTLDAGSVTLVHSDGPYGMNKAEWDKVRDLAAWYRPHIAEWGRVCAPSASVYLWNTAEGWAAVHPEMVGAGWTFRSLVMWDKRMPASMLGWRNIRTWPDQAEVCGFYQRGRPHFQLDACIGNVWTFHVGHLWSEQIKSEEVTVHRTDGNECHSALHPSQKPLLFARRIVEASSRPGDLVLEPFAGTCRIAAACEDIARWEPEKARRYVCVEMDADGRDYIPAVLASLRGEPTNAGAAGQVSLFGAAK